MRAGPLILHRSHGDAPRKFAYKIFWHLLHGYPVVLPHLLLALSFRLPSAIFLTFLVLLLLPLLLLFLLLLVARRHRDPLMCRSRVSSSFLFRFPQKPCPFDRFESQRELYLAVRQASRGTNRSHSPRGTIEAAPFELLVPSETLEYAATLTFKRLQWNDRNEGNLDTAANQPQIMRGKTAPDGINLACGLGGISIVTL